MKKILLTMAFVLTALGNVWADDVTVGGKVDQTITDGTIEIPAKNSALLCISLSNSAQYKQGFQFLLELPEGVTVVDEYLSDRFVKDAVLTKSEPTTGNYQYLCYAVDKTPLSGNDGEVVIIELQADESLSEGATLKGKISGIEFSQIVAEAVIVTKFDDMTFNITIGEEDDRVYFYENSKRLPRYEAGTTRNISMKRTIKKNEWSTIVLPFNLTKAKAIEAFGDNVEFAKYNGYVIDLGDDPDNLTPLCITIKFSNYEIPKIGSLAGGTPVLIKTQKDIDNIQLDNVKLVNTISDQNHAADEYDIPGKMTGTFVKSMIPEDGIFLSENKLWYAASDIPIKAFRGWLELDVVVGKEIQVEETRIIWTFDDGEKTGVKEVYGTSDDNRIFDLQGRRVSKPAKNGLYIKDGKKILVK